MSTPRNTIINGDCIEVMKTIPSESVDFILTDPPYLVNYKDRSGRSIQNDKNADWLAPAFAQMYRVLKPDTCAFSFYGWSKVDHFFAAWRRAGFRVGAHVIFRKSYVSKSSFFSYTHEGAYLLLKGNPAKPATPLPDVLDWAYTGNKLHPTQKSVAILKPLIETFTKPGEIVLDPFSGSGSTCVAAHRLQRGYIGIELDPEHCKTANKRLDAMTPRAKSSPEIVACGKYQSLKNFGVPLSASEA